MEGSEMYRAILSWLNRCFRWIFSWFSKEKKKLPPPPPPDENVVKDVEDPPQQNNSSLLLMLPFELVLHILTFASVRDLFFFRSVCSQAKCASEFVVKSLQHKDAKYAAAFRSVTSLELENGFFGKSQLIDNQLLSQMQRLTFLHLGDCAVVSDDGFSMKCRLNELRIHVCVIEVFFYQESILPFFFFFL